MTTSANTQKSFNLILITLDALRADHAGTSGQNAQTLIPTVRKFFTSGAIFLRAFSQTTYTWGAFAALFTSHYPARVTFPNGVLKSNVPTLAELLHAYGYRTAGFHSNPFLSAAFGYHRGFEVCDDGMLRWGARVLPPWLYPAARHVWRFLQPQPYTPAEQITKRSLAWLRKGSHTDQPFFLWAHYMDPHGPYQSKNGIGYLNKLRAERLWRKAVKHTDTITGEEKDLLMRNYREEIAYADQWVGRLLQFLNESGLVNNTMVIFCSDHGEAFLERGKFGHPRFLYDELIHVPLMIRHPDIQERIEISDVVGLIDLMPTILRSVGWVGDYSQFDGYELWPLIRGKSGEHRPPYVLSDGYPDREATRVSIRTKDWKLIIGDDVRELYDLRSDPKEQSNLIDVEMERARELEVKLAAEAEKIGISTDPFQPMDVDEEVLRRLEALGYIEWVDQQSPGGEE